MKYKEQKTGRSADLPWFFYPGLRRCKVGQKRLDLDSVNLLSLIAVGILLPLNSLFGLRRAKAAEDMQKKLAAEKDCSAGAQL